jgi:hypothetical protein
LQLYLFPKKFSSAKMRMLLQVDFDTEN